MNMQRMLSDLARSGLHLWLDGDELRYRADKDSNHALSLEKIRSHKADILAHLAQERSALRDRAAQILNSRWPEQDRLPVRIEQLWRMEKFRADVFMHLPFAVRLEGSVRIEQVKAALEIMVGRHPALRTRLQVSDGEPHQCIEKIAPPEVAAFDAADISEERLHEAMAEFINRPFNLLAGPSFRVCLYKIPENSHVLLMVLHHFFGDAWSMQLLATDFTRAYALAAQSKENWPGAAVRSYGEYSAWQRKELHKKLDDYLSFWKRTLVGAFANTLKADHRGNSGLEGSLKFEIPGDAISALDAACRTTGSTIPNVLFSIYQLALGLRDGTPDITTALSLAARSKKEFAGTVGYLVNSIPIRSRLVHTRSFYDLVRDITRSVAEASAYQDMPVEIIEEILDLPPGFCRAQFNYAGPSRLPTGSAARKPGGTAIYNVSGLLDSIAPHVKARRDICLRLVMSSAGIFGIINYDLDLFREETIQHLAADYLRILDHALAEPQASLSELAAILTSS